MLASVLFFGLFVGQVPPGEFDIGADSIADARPVHTAAVEALYLGLVLSPMLFGAPRALVARLRRAPIAAWPALALVAVGVAMALVLFTPGGHRMPYIPSWFTTSGLGPNDVVVHVTDGRTGSYDHAFTLNVVEENTPNHLPVVSSSPPGPAVVGRPYQYSIRATDADGDPLYFQFKDGFAHGASIDCHNLGRGSHCPWLGYVPKRSHRDR